MAQPHDTFEMNPRVAAMQPSATLAMSARARQLKREGRPVISLSAGEPDFPTPEPISEAGRRAITDGHTRYTDNMGLPELREAISEKLRRDNDLAYPVEQILCSNGAKQSIAMAISVLCRPGDEVLIPAPYWVSYPEMVRFAGAEPVAISTSAADDYRLRPEALEDAITPRTRLLILCSPSNPTGSVYPRAELEALAEILRRHEHVYVLSDEIYEYVIFDEEHVSFASLPEMKSRTITVNGFSKAYSMTGWRLGYLAAEREIVKGASNLQSQFTSAPSTMTQYAGLAALQMDRGPIEEMVQAFRKRRDSVLTQLRAIDGVNCPTPDGAFYLFPQVDAFFGRKRPDGREITSADDLCFYLLEEHDVALVPGEGFGDPTGARLSYATSMEELDEAMRRIRRGLESLV
jgi:aspartate aminotransferase